MEKNKKALTLSDFEKNKENPFLKEAIEQIQSNIVKRYNAENVNNSTTRSSQDSDDKMTLSEIETKINQ